MTHNVQMNLVFCVKNSWRFLMLFAFLNVLPSLLMPIPEFDHNGVLPPHAGDPCIASQQSPYHCTTVELVERFGHNYKRKKLLLGFLDFRHRMRDEGMLNAFQWVDGSFVENIEKTEGRYP